MLGTVPTTTTPSAEADLTYTANGSAATQALTFTATDASGSAHSKPSALTPTRPWAPY